MSYSGRLQREESVMSLRILDAKVELMAVKTCSKAISAYGRGHGKSPCFLEVAFLQSVGPDYLLLILRCVDGAKNMECAL